MPAVKLLARWWPRRLPMQTPICLNCSVQESVHLLSTPKCPITYWNMACRLLTNQRQEDGTVSLILINRSKHLLTYYYRPLDSRILNTRPWHSKSCRKIPQKTRHHLAGWRSTNSRLFRLPLYKCSSSHLEPEHLLRRRIDNHNGHTRHSF